jgi:hypothetical protein
MAIFLETLKRFTINSEAISESYLGQSKPKPDQLNALWN